MKLRLELPKGSTISTRMMAAELAFVALILIAYLVNVPLLVLATFALACGLVVFSDVEKSIYYLAFFTSFSCTFMYDGKHMFFVMVALFIIRYVLTQKLDKKTVLLYLVLIVYSVLFSNSQVSITFANMIGPILLFAIPVIGDAAKKIDCRKFIHHYIFGFLITTIFGFFVTSIPAMLELFSYDLWWTADNQELTRFFGLAYDSNFYALSNYIVLAYLLFTKEKPTIREWVVILFLIYAGLQTLSKSYLLMLAVLAAGYCFKQRKSTRQLLSTIAVVGVASGVFILISDAIGYNVIEMIMGRFVSGSFAENTTGRVEIWETYFDYFYTSGVKELLFGNGFNDYATKAAHNTFIEIFFHYGIVGTAIWVGYFMHCWELYSHNTREYTEKTSATMICLCVGIFFLSAYTYESLWVGIVIAFMTLPYTKKKRRRWLSV